MMNKNLEQIFDKALSELKKGASLEDAILKCQPEQENLAENLEIAVRLSKMPKKAVPQPAMQRKYALLPAKTAWYLSFKISKFITVSMSLTLLLTAGLSTGYAAYQSLPGQPLFAVKKNAEQLRVKFASTQVEKTNLQMELSKKRLSEARIAIASPEINPEIAKASITELEKQTKVTLDTAKSVITQDASPSAAAPIITSLELLAKEQENLAKDTKTEDKKEVVAKAEESAKENVKQIAEIKKYISAAASSDVDLVDLKPLEEKAKSQENKSEIKYSGTSTPKTEIENEIPLPTTEEIVGGYILEDPAPQFMP